MVFPDAVVQPSRLLANSILRALGLDLCLGSARGAGSPVRGVTNPEPFGTFNRERSADHLEFGERDESGNQGEDQDGEEAQL